MSGARLFLALSLLFAIGTSLAEGGDSAVASRTEEDEVMMEISRAWRVYSWYVFSRSSQTAPIQRICTHPFLPSVTAPSHSASTWTWPRLSAGRFLQPRTSAWPPPFSPHAALLLPLPSPFHLSLPNFRSQKYLSTPLCAAPRQAGAGAHRRRRRARR
jgi:hypothetical protein